MLIDSHAHVNFNAFRQDSEEVLKRSLAAGTWVINVGSQFSTSQRAIELAKKFKEGVYAAVGLHPIHLSGEVYESDEWEEISITPRQEEFVCQKYKELAQSKKVVAIGETGLDYYRMKNEELRIKNLQKEVLLQHLKLAQELNKPVIFHCRDAYDDLLPLIPQGTRGVVHCFSAGPEIAKKFLALGLYLGFTGIITFPKTIELQEAVKSVPLDRILIETDCPYLAPQPKRGKRNEPLYVQYVAEKIAELKNISFAEIAEIITKNSRKLFGL